MTAQELKNSILQHAVQGKLAPQDPNDEPASILLERIKVEKAQLIKDKKIKAEKPFAPISEDEIPFEIPESWVWVRLGIISINRDGNRVPISQKDREIKKKIYPYYGASGIIDKIDGYTHDGKFLLIGEDGANLRAKSTPIAFLASGKIWVNNHAHVLEYFDDALLKYMIYCLNILNINPFISGGFQPKLSQGYLNIIPIPLPPLSEQQRIVAKIEELMPLVEEYDKAEKELTELNAKFPEQIKKSVLQYAIQGKLVAHSEADEPASELLKRIKAEKQQLIREKKIKAEKPLPPITEEEIPFEIPESWVWVRLGEVISLNSGQDLLPNQYSDVVDSGIPYITGASNIDKGNIIINRWTKTPKSIAIKGDLLLTCKGTVGKIAYLNIEKAHIARQIMSIKYFIVDYKYISLVLETQIESYKQKANSFIPGIDRSIVLNTLFPLPPLSEQQRIVEKVEEVLGVCEGLK
jgi:type I restriction enzyme, S subunit